MRVDRKIIAIIKNLYKQTLFKVEIEGVASDWEPQNTGIRQGCPLSPYLFLVVMTVMFHDVHEKTRGNLIQHRQPGATFDEVMYADDTICISPDTKAMNKFIAAIEQEGEKHGLKLNYKKCELLTTERNPNVKFRNQEKVPRKDQVTYLGCDLNMEGNTRRELNRRITSTIQTMKRLDKYWIHSNCPIRKN